MGPQPQSITAHPCETPARLNARRAAPAVTSERFRVVGTHDQESCRDVWQLFSAGKGGDWALQGTPFPSKTAAQKAAEQPVSSD